MPTYAQLQAEPWWGRELVTPEFAWLHEQVAAALGIPRGNVGSKGDNAHLNGAHRSQEWILNSRYCTNRSYTVQAGLSADQVRHLAGCDITPKNLDQMLAISRNVDREVRAGRLEEVREWYGNVDGDSRVDGYNNVANRVASSDSSHLWHLHLSIDRRALRDMTAMRRILAAITGNPTEGDPDMALEGIDKAQVNNAERYSAAIFNLSDKAQGISNTVTAQDVPSPFTAAFKKLTADVAEIKGRAALDPTAVAAAMVKDTTFITTLAAAVAAQVTLHAGATADEVRKVVDEELDEQSRGGADTD